MGLTDEIGSVRGGLVYLAALPRTCHVASAHEAMVCAGSPPEYAMSGFGPFALGWGWMLIGMWVGVTTTLLVLLLTGHIRRDVSMATLARLAAPSPATQMPNQVPLPDVLNYLAAGGRTALQDMSAAMGISETEVLQRALGVPRQQPTQPLHTGEAASSQIQLPHYMPGANMFYQ